MKLDLHNYQRGQ